MATYQQHLKAHIGDSEILHVFSLSEEFKYMVVREEEKPELKRYIETVPIPIKEAYDVRTRGERRAGREGGRERRARGGREGAWVGAKEKGIKGGKGEGGEERTFGCVLLQGRKKGRQSTASRCPLSESVGVGCAGLVCSPSPSLSSTPPPSLLPSSLSGPLGKGQRAAAVLHLAAAPRRVRAALGHGLHHAERGPSHASHLRARAPPGLGGPRTPRPRALQGVRDVGAARRVGSGQEVRGQDAEDANLLVWLEHAKGGWE